MRRPAADPKSSQADPRHGQPEANVESRWRQRGQVVVIFAGSLIAMMMLMALVVDLGWYWSNGLKMQRAADAAALAGAVYMPDNFTGPTPNAQSAALAAAQRNGYVPDANTTITSVKDANPRQIDVTITDKVGTFFLKVIGIQTLDATRSSKAEFVLPVPMGSPQNYYGVGTFVNLVTAAPTNNPFTNPAGYTNVSNPTSGISPSANTTSHTSGGAWTTPQNAYSSDAAYATSSTNLNQDAWTTFTFGGFQAGATFDGVVVNLQAKVASGANCQIRTEVSWDAGLTWSNKPFTTANLTTSDQWYVMGSSTVPTAWDTVHTSWGSGDFSSTNFQVRLTNLKNGGCGKASVNEITAVVYSHTVTTYSPVETVQPVNGPLGAPLTTQGFWGADITKGGDRSNGDQFDPWTNGNPDYDGLGVDYTVVIAGPGGQVQLYDPTFCATAVSSGGGSYGTGDHWIGGPANGVTTVYSLFDENGTPYDINDDIAKGTTGGLFANEVQSDKSGAFGAPPNGRDCSGDPYHNKWYVLASGLPAGTYRLNVSTNVPGNLNTNAENMWSAWVSSTTGKSQIYGQGKMVTYNNLLSGTQLFYLAQIDKVHAGKTMEIKLFDPGDVTGDAFMKILSPDGNVYNYVDFTYTADNGRSGSSDAQHRIQTAAAPNNSFYQGALVTITIKLPTTYGTVGLRPPSEASTGDGWWKIEYTVAGGNDTTTWQVDIQGNPVHLLVP